MTRQLRYSRDETQRALDLVLFINGLPIATFELKNSLTKQTVADAVEQYKRDRDPNERLFEFGRCAVHFAVDEQEVQFCTHLKGKGSWFLPFNQGWNDGAGNPPNPAGLKTDYLWKRILTREGLTDILENYAQVVEFKDEKTGKKKRAQIWPRYHQLDVVRRLLADAREHGTGRRYLIEHSAGSGKSNSIAWLAHQLIGLRKDDAPAFDSIIVVTDRQILDRQIRDTIRQFAQVGATVGHAEHSGDLRRFIEGGKKIIISTVQKFPFILDEIGSEHRGRRFAIVIDEAHSSQGGRTSAAVSLALSTAGAEEDDETTEDRINRIMEARKLLPNASYFAFTATPKNKTLELFGEAYLRRRPEEAPAVPLLHDEAGDPGALHPGRARALHAGRELLQAREDGRGRPGVRHEAREEEAPPLRREPRPRDPAQGRDHGRPLPRAGARASKIGGQARAMVVTSGIERAIQYYHAIRDYLLERKSPHRAIVAFSGEHEYDGVKVTEASLNGFPSNQIADKIQEEPYRFLVCADKFQTGYDEPLLHTMYVDKILSGIKAVQTLSRLNRAHPQKHDVFVLDFMNDPETIETAFADYYRTTILSEETDPNKLHDLKRELDAAEVYTQSQVDDLVERYLGGADRDQLDPILDACVAVYKERLDEDGQVDFKAQGEGVRADLRLPGLHPALHERRLGEAVDLPELPRVEAARPEGGRPLEGHPGSDRHGQLPGREEGGPEDPARGRRRRDRPGADERGRAEARAGARPALEHPPRVQRPVREHPVDRLRPDPPAHHPRHPEPRRRRPRVPEREEELRPAERAHRARQGPPARHDRRPHRRHAALQGVQRQRVVPAVADRARVRADVRR